MSVLWKVVIKGKMAPRGFRPSPCLSQPPNLSIRFPRVLEAAVLEEDPTI